LAEVEVVPCDISLAGRVLAAFPEKLTPEQRVPDNLKWLGELCSDPTCSIIKLPNISAPLNQLQDCISELRSKGYDVPLYPKSVEQYQKLLGSAVNPVLRSGNSDRRVAPPVKAYAQKNPHRMGLWSKASRTHVAHMSHGDFYESEQSCILPHATSVSIQLLQSDDNEVVTLKQGIPMQEGEIMDAATLSVAALNIFFETEMEDAKESELLLSLHLKATMMKVSDPILFGHAIQVYFKEAFEKHEAVLDKVGANTPNQGLSSMFELLDAAVGEGALAEEEAKQIKKDFEACEEHGRPWLAMVNSDKGISNLHAPNDIIIDASMPVVVRDSGKMWNKCTSCACMTDLFLLYLSCVAETAYSACCP
jgi:isocitrate dehydrogenase